MKKDRSLEWPAATRQVVERIEARIRAKLDAMTEDERTQFWRAVPWPFYPGARRQPNDYAPCVKCGTECRRYGDTCEACD